MKFINRASELRQLQEYFELSKRQLITVAISGLRRVGKTTLVKEHIKNKKSVYFFVYESKTSTGLLREFCDQLRRQGIISELESISSWHVFFDIVFKRCENYSVVFDEFQNFLAVDKKVFSIIQRDCDEYKTRPLCLIFLGSLIGLFRKIFEDRKEPLYGRIDAKLRLSPFTLGESIEAMKHLKFQRFQDMLKIYSLFGGFPKYYAALEKFRLVNNGYFEIIEYLFMQENAPLENEVSDILKQEFGRRSSLYYSILHSIAKGKTRLNEIAGATQMKESSITRHLGELEEKFSLVMSARPFDNKRNTKYFISHPLLLFWFRFVYDKFSAYTLKDSVELMSSVKTGFNTFFGRRFEDICREFMLELSRKKKLPKIDYIANWWGSARIEGERKEIEIDLLALSGKNIMFIECKWKDNVDTNRVLKKLTEKSRFVQWQGDRRYCIIAKSFKKRSKDALLFDLRDMEETFNTGFAR